VATPLQQSEEWAAWAPVSEGWKPLQGRFYSEGWSIESHQFQTPREIDWAESFHGNGLEICFNLSGIGRLSSGKTALEFSPGSEGFYRVDPSNMKGARLAQESHHFVTVELTAGYLKKHLEKEEDKIYPVVRKVMEEKKSVGEIGMTRALTMPHRLLASALMNPPVQSSAQGLWYQGKVLEIIAEMLYVPVQEELFCARQKRVARDRVDEAKRLLGLDLENTPSLEELGKKIGCSPFYLSRTFSQETGMTMSQYLRSLRMEKAAELLRSGKYNVTEAALAVGYNSLSHFSKVFCEVFGKCPCAFPLKSKE
jgi:AraC-like DNA-binding protein